MGRRGGTAGLRVSLAVVGLGAVLVAVVWSLLEESTEPGVRSGLPTPPVAADELSLPERALVGDEPTPLTPASDAPAVLHEGPPAPGPPVYSGHVAGPDEQPVVDARIQLHPSGSGDWQERQPLVETRTAADGSFRLELPARPDEPLLVYAEADGYLARSVSPIEPGQPLSITLGWVATAYGTVRDAETGAPIEGARVSSMRGADVLSAADGTYAIDGVVVGQENRVRAEHPDYVSSAELFHVRTRNAVQVDLALSPGVGLEIPVVDRVTGAPLPGAAFRYALEGAPFAYADDAGRYTTRVSAGSEHHLYVTHEGYASLHWIWEVTDPDARHPPTVPLLPLSSIVGRVEDTEGRPLEGVSVFAANDGRGGSYVDVPEAVREAYGLTGRARERASSSASTDAAGRFVVEVLSLESPYTLTANREGLAPCRSSPVLVAIPGQRVDVSLVCPQAAVVYGHVTQNGEPMRWGHLSALAPDGSYLGRGGTDGNGDYRMDRLAAGDVIVRVEGAADPTVEARLTVEAGQEYRQDFDWDEIRGRITGRVTHEDGRPAVAVPVWAQGDSGATETDATGAYELVVAPGPLYTVSVMGPFTRSVEGVAAGDEDIDFVLPTVGTLNIQLVDADTREPLRLASDETRHRWLSWRAPGDALFQRVSRPALDVDGVVELKLPVGDVELSLHLERAGYAARKVTLAVRDEPDPEPVPVLLQGGHSVRLRFVPDEAASGSTFPEFARVFVLEDSERGLLRGPFPDRDASPHSWDWDVDTWVGDPGLFERLVHAGSTAVVELTGLPAGRYTLLPFGADVRFTPATFDMPRPEDTVLEVRWSSSPR